MSKTIYQNARLRGKEGLFAIIADNDTTRISAIMPMEGLNVQNEAVFDLNGALVCEPFVETHIHLDYVNTCNLSELKTKSGTLFEAIDNFSRFKSSLTREGLVKRALDAVKLEASHGVQAIRSHVDVTDPNLTALKAMLEVKEKVADLVEIQLVAFPQEGVYAYTKADSIKLIEEAVRMGCKAVGAIPHFEFTREEGIKSLREIISIAEKYDTLVDVHCDETDDEQSRFSETLASLAYHSGLKSRVTASHTCAMGSYNSAYAFKMMTKYLQSGMNFVCCPTENCYLQGRYDGYPKRRGLTRADELIASGLNLTFAQDSIADPWYPLGNGNLINQLDFGLHLCHLVRPDILLRALDFISVNGAKTLGLEDSSLREGGPASFVALDAVSDEDAVKNRSEVLWSVRNNKVIVRKSPCRVEYSAF